MTKWTKPTIDLVVINIIITINIDEHIRNRQISHNLKLGKTSFKTNK